VNLAKVKEATTTLKEQIDWRSPISNRPQAIITLPRDMAMSLTEYLEQELWKNDQHRS
jgi:hypothetical protein